VTEWYEERVTAAVQGRPIFTSVLNRLKADKTTGLIIHKIDRGARNMSDWAELGNLIDRGIDVRFVCEDMNLRSRGGRLAADIQAVVAADYVRNLKEEVRKGFYGRLSQGLFPLPAPIGYRNAGGGKAKTFDPEKSGLVRQAFQLYATRNFTAETLTREMTARGLTGAFNRPLSPAMILRILRNPFYTGRIHIRESSFEGCHETEMKCLGERRILPRGEMSTGSALAAKSEQGRRT
jgi:DNA invertase Pin-like site-specific DNA recombinase